MTDDEILKLHDEQRALVLATLERLSTSLVPHGSYATILSKKDVEKIIERQHVIEAEFLKARQEARTGLLLPPGARS